MACNAPRSSTNTPVAPTSVVPRASQDPSEGVAWRTDAALARAITSAIVPASRGPISRASASSSAVCALWSPSSQSITLVTTTIRGAIENAA
jgi:hypothetical protein